MPFLYTEFVVFFRMFCASRVVGGPPPTPRQPVARGWGTSHSFCWHLTRMNSKKINWLNNECLPFFENSLKLLALLAFWSFRFLGQRISLARRGRRSLISQKSAGHWHGSYVGICWNPEPLQLLGMKTTDNVSRCIPTWLTQQCKTQRSKLLFPFWFTKGCN